MDEEVVNNLAAGGEMPLRKNHQGDTMSARWPKTGKSWCMNNGDIPNVMTAGESCWGRRLRAIPMENCFTMDGREIGTNSVGQHSFLADPSLKEWLESSEAGIAFWVCYLFPFIRKYSATDCVKVIQQPPAWVKVATEWARARMTASTHAPNVRAYVREHYPGFNLPGPQPTDVAATPTDVAVPSVDPQTSLFLKQLLEKGEVRLTIAAVRRSKVLKGTSEQKVRHIEEMCENPGGLVLRSSNGVYLIKVPDLKSVAPPELVQHTEYFERFHISKLEYAEHVLHQLAPLCTTDKRKEKLRYTKKYLGKLRACVTAGDQSVTKKTAYAYSKRLHPYLGGRRFAKGCGAQGILRCVRAALCQGAHKRDKDIKGAHTSIAHGLLKIATRHVPIAKLRSFPSYAEYLHTPHKFMDLICAGYSCSSEQAKHLVLARLNGGVVANWAKKFNVSGVLPKEVQQLFTEFDLVRDILVQSRPDVLRAAAAAGSQRPELTSFSYILCEQEDKALRVMERVAESLGVRVESLAFDGLVLDFADVRDVDIVDQRFHEVVQSGLLEALGYPLLIAEKPWDATLLPDEGEGGIDMAGDDSDTEVYNPPERDLHRGLHQCIPRSLKALGVAVSPEHVQGGPYSYRYVLSKVPGLHLAPVCSVDVDGIYLWHIDGTPMGHCLPVSVKDREAYETGPNGERTRPFSAAQLKPGDVVFRVLRGNIQSLASSSSIGQPEQLGNDEFLDLVAGAPKHAGDERTTSLRYRRATHIARKKPASFSLCTEVSANGLLEGSQAMFTRLTECPVCPNHNRLSQKGQLINAFIWNGGSFEKVVHGRKRCKKCGRSFRLNYYVEPHTHEKMNTMELTELACTDNPIYLLQSHFGVRIKYLELLYNRVYRAAQPLQAEATSIAMTWPGAPMPKGTEHHFGIALGQAFFSYLRMREGVVSFDIDNPVPTHDPDYGTASVGIYTIFDAAKHDPLYDVSLNAKIDVVTDGNVVITRSCVDPAELLWKRPYVKRAKSEAKKAAQASRSCKEVADVERALNMSSDRTEGIYGTFNMSNSNPAIVHLAEMLNAECTAYKLHCAKEVAAHACVGIFCHDCGCKLASQMEGVYCDVCFVDAWHVKKHCCDKALFDPAHPNNAGVFHARGLNTEYAEQSWVKFNKFAAITRTMTRSKFRCFLRHYCIWRNRYMRSNSPRDINPAKSMKSYTRLRRLKTMRLLKLAKRAKTQSVQKKPSAKFPACQKVLKRPSGRFPAYQKVLKRPSRS